MTNQDIPRLIKLGLIPAHIGLGWNKNAPKTETTDYLREEVESRSFYLVLAPLFILVSAIGFCLSANYYRSQQPSFAATWMILGVIAGVFGAIALLIVIRKRNIINSRAMADQLIDLATYSGIPMRKLLGADESDVKNICFNCLVGHAKNVIIAERLHFQAEQLLIKAKEKEGWRSVTAQIIEEKSIPSKAQAIQIAREKFKSVHAVFKQFGLVKDAWDEHFEAAARALPPTESTELAQA